MSFYKNSQWSKSALHNKNKNKILNLQNYKTALSSYKNIIILYNIITNFKNVYNMPPFFIASQSVTMATKTLQQAPCQVFNQCELDSNNNVPSGDSSQSQRRRKRLVIIDLDSDQSIDIVTRDPFKKAVVDVCRPFLRTLQRRNF